MENEITMKGIDLAREVEIGENAFANPVFNSNALLKYPLYSDDEVAGAGQPVTLRAACAMIDTFFASLIAEINAAAKISDDFKDAKTEEVLNRGFAAVFGKETIARLLLQRGCEGIRIYSCKDDHGKNSLLLSAVDKDWKDLVAVNIDAQNNYITDVIISTLKSKLTTFPDSNIELDEKHGPGGGKYTLEDYVINRQENIDANMLGDSINSLIELKTGGKISFQ
ncbi:hypothetical protein [Spirosoma jeollabukense]